MTARKYHIVGLGAALVDVTANVTEEELTALGTPKGAMELVGPDEALALLEKISIHTHAAGGSAANTIAGTANLGLASGFVGKVADDDFGRVFTDDLDKTGITLSSLPLQGGAPTGCCIVLVTPDAERTMHTMIGAAAAISPADLDIDMLRDTELFFTEGYVFDSPQGGATFTQACEMVHAGGGRAVLSLSDAFCVDRHRERFLQALAGEVDLLMANLSEACAMFNTDGPQGCVAAMQQAGLDGVITRSEKGAIAIIDGTVHEIAAAPVAAPVDLTGAGDQFAAGFLSGLAMGSPVGICGRRGALAAAEVISHFGPRPQTNLAALLSDAGV